MGRPFSIECPCPNEARCVDKGVRNKGRIQMKQDAKWRRCEWTVQETIEKNGIRLLGLRDKKASEKQSVNPHESVQIEVLQCAAYRTYTASKHAYRHTL
mmetsp:Transcript_74580/g.124396  ORF Transcript_74580/g.124396 Transcript_74580/m.124396 type:complete len:99 (-) Transcript_74580:172-468(-)